MKGSCNVMYLVWRDRRLDWGVNTVRAECAVPSFQRYHLMHAFGELAPERRHFNATLNKFAAISAYDPVPRRDWRALACAQKRVMYEWLTACVAVSDIRAYTSFFALYRDRLKGLYVVLREISPCSCLTVLPGPAWVLLSKANKLLFPPLYTA